MGRRAAVVRLRVDARRPASWLALVAGGAAAWWIAGEPSDRWPAAALVAGAVVAAAAVGAPPRESPAGIVAWAAMRAAWPAAGAVGAWLLRAPDPATAVVPAALVAAVAGTAAVIAAATRGGLSPADATGQSLACGIVAAACAAGAAATEWATSTWPLAACAGWAATATACAIARRGGFARDPAPRGGAGGALLRVATVMSLVGMVVFLFLAPHLARFYAALGVAWLLVAAAPRGAFGPGSAPTASGWPPARAAARHAATYAAVLVWPPLVAAILAGSSAAASEPLAIAAAIGLVAAVIAATAAITSGLGWSRDTSLAVVLCAALAACAIGAGAARGRDPRPVSPPGLMLSNPGDPARLPTPRRNPRAHL